MSAVDSFFEVPRLKFLTAILFSILPILAANVRSGEEAEFQRSKGFYTLQEYQLAAEALDKFVAAYPKSDHLEDARLLQAESFYQLKKYGEAVKAFDVFLTSHAQSARRPDALLRAMKSSAVVKDFAKSLKYAAAFIEENRAKLKAAPAQDPIQIKMATALYHAGDSSYSLKDFAKAQAYWEELLTALPKSPLVPDAADGLGWIYFDNKDYTKASSTFFMVAETPNHPRAAWAKLMQGRSLAELKRMDEALAAIKLAPTLSGSSKELEAESALRSAELALQAGKLPEALANYRRLAKDFPALPSAVPALATATSKFYEAKQFAEAAEMADEFLKLTSATPSAPNRAALGRIRARSLLALNKNAEALEAAKQSVKDSDAAPGADRAASLMLLAELDPKEAPRLLKEVGEKYSLTPFAFAAQYELARQAGEAAKFDEALTLTEKLLEDVAKAPADNPGAAQIKRDALFAAGEFAFRKPDAKKAALHLAAYAKAFGEKDDRADDVARKLGWSLHESGDHAAAAAALDAALPAHLKSQFRAEMLYVRALAAGKLGNADDALKFDEALTTEFPDSPFADDALYDAAAILYKRKQLEPALKKLDAMLAKATLKPALKNPAMQLRASVRIQTNKFAEALSDADELLTKGGADGKLNLPALRLIKALSLLSIPGKEAEALGALNELIQKGPADAPEIRQGIARRAYILFKDKKYAEAKSDFLILSDSTKAATPQEAIDASLHLAAIHRELKETAESKALLAKLAEQKLEGIAAFEVPFQLGNFLFESGDNAGAVKSYERALAGATGQKIMPASLSAARLNLAWALVRLNEKEKAQKMFEELVKEDPAGQYAAEGLFERARILSEQAKTADALPLWREIQDKFAASPYAEKALFLQGQAFAQTGKFKEAAESFQLHADKFPAINAKETLCGLAESHLHLNDLVKAKEIFTKVLGAKGIEAELDDTSERALLGLAEIALKSDDPGAAKKLALRILTENSASPWSDAAYLISGQASEGLKEPEKAIGYYRKLVTDRPKSTHVPAAQERLRALGAPK